MGAWVGGMAHRPPCPGARVTRYIFARRRWYQDWNWPLILAVLACLFIWAGFIYWVIGIA